MTDHPPRPSRRRLALAAVVVLFALLARPARAHLRAASLLVRFADAGATGFVADFGKGVVDETDVPLGTPGGEARARLYTPRGVVDAPGVVIVHGVHRLGIDEPRLVRFARAIAATGVVVLTPEVKEIADYRIDPRSIDTLGAAAGELRRRLGHGRVGIMGMSFAGGLALLAAAEPRFAADIGFVVAVGAHDDLARVLRFFSTNTIERPDGSTEHLEAHHYGALVMIYGNMERFVPASDVAVARDAIRLLLWQQEPEARVRAREFGPEGRRVVEALLDGRLDAIAPLFAAEIARDAASTAVVSPHGHLGAMRVPVFLLHGAGDTVIPASETLWLATEVPPEQLRAALVSPALVHVELQGEPPLDQRLALVHFMAGVLDEADDAGR